MSLRTLGLFTTLALALAGAREARAQSLEEEQAAMESGEGADGRDADAAEPAGEDPARLGDEQAAMEDEAPVEASTDNLDPTEAEDEDYFFLGAFYRHVVIPGFMQELFVEGGIDASNPGAGLQFLWRRNNLNVGLNVWWNNAQGTGFFRAQGDPRTDTEYIDVQLGVVFVNAELMWSFPITEWFAIELGFDLGVGFIYGDLVRTEAYESSPGADDWRACDGPVTPNANYCEASGGHYDYVEPSWADGGDRPVVFPWISFPHLALRFKPIHQIQIRVDGGYGLYGFFFGGGVSYGF